MEADITFPRPQKGQQLRQERAGLLQEGTADTETEEQSV